MLRRPLTLNAPSRGVPLVLLFSADWRTPVESSASDGVLAAVQRELAHLVAGDHLAALARVGLDQRRRAGDLDLLGQLADRQLHVDAQPGADLHLDVVGERDREAGFFGRHQVDAALDRDELVGAVAGGGPRQRNAGRRVGQRDLGVRHDRAGLVADGADDGGGFELRARRRGAREKKDQAEQRGTPDS